jgi:hypothetical protein
MKKEFLIGVILLLMGAQVFAMDRADLFEDQKRSEYLGFLKNEYCLSKFDSIIDSNDSCLSNCWADVYYEGEYVATFYDSAMGSNCSEATMNCVAKLNSRLAVFMYAPR